ncbi:MAG: hypothetical protein ABSH19_08915, partial [Opitutales bacterium]
LAYFGTDDPDYYGIKAQRLPCYPAWQDPALGSLKPGIYAISATLFQSIYTNTEGPWNKTYEADYQNCLKNLRVYLATKNDPVRRAQLLQRYPTRLWVVASQDFVNLRFGRLCAWLRHNREPTDNVNHSILIWNLSAADIRAALGGPPAELNDAPIWSHSQNSPIKTAQS